MRLNEALSFQFLGGLPQCYYTFLSDNCCEACHSASMSTHLAEEAGDESFPDVDVVVFAGELSAGAAEGEAVHDPGQLLPHTVGQLEGAVADKIIVAPLGILPV